MSMLKIYSKLKVSTNRENFMKPKVFLMISNQIIRESLYIYLSQIKELKNFKFIKDESQEEHHDIIICDKTSLMLENKFNENAKRLLIDDGLSEKEQVELILKHNIFGIIGKTTTKDLMVKCLNTVINNEPWFSKKIIQYICNNKVEFIKQAKNLTDREMEILKMICEGMTNKEIAKKLFISENTVKAHIYKIFKKSGIKKRTQLTKLMLNKI